ncbi:unnamed protein product [Phaedon cochleariae]|uniref:Uncharacterized protein n=1 Tax=Phaedon cochleariae TaxID=80249 RepID=A0A9N9SLL7_PHACE|nr:unnamed protein product [Phaedon cochleariae]
MASQYQDHQKQRYAQQQRMDMKNGLSMRIPITPTVQLARSQNLNQNQAEQTEDWQPFQPTPIPKNVTVQRKSKTIRLRTKSKRNKTKAINSGDSIKAAGSERIETKKQIDRQDIPDSDKIAGEVVYIPPSLLQQVLGNSEKGRVLGDINGHEISRVDFSALSDLVGKNPNVQLEGLQRLLEETSGDAPVFPVIQGPQPFKKNDHTPITEKTNDIPNPNTRPNIKVDHEQTPRVSSIIPTTPVAQNSLENIQKQLDEASKLDADDALARAQAQAKAHVEAQHKAIEEAQKAIFEKVQKSFGNSQALPLVQINPQVLNQLSFSPTPSADDISAISYVPKLRVEKPATISVPLNPALDVTLTTPAPISGKLFSPAVSSIQEASIPELNGRPNKVSLNSFDNNAPLHQYPSKNVQYYAPNHIHQAATQLQAERTLMAQVKSQNEAILNSLQSPNTIVRHQTVSAQKRMRNKNIQKISSDVLEPTKYQQSNAETQPEKLKVVDSGSGKQLNGSDNVSESNIQRFKRHVG